MAATLLLGNGPNRLDGAPVSWQQVMDDVARLEPQDEGRFSMDRPLPLLFEELALRRDRRGSDGRRELKQAFAESVQELAPNAIHRLIMSCGFAHVMTTNYDYCLELARHGAMPERQESEFTLRESKYSVFRHRSVGPTKIWHIHGEASQPDSLQLGYEHYGSGLSKIEQFVGPGHRNQVSLFSPSRGDRQSSPPVSWVDVFLKDDVHIVGLGLDFVEVDLWWLLVLKERLRCTGKRFAGRTYYHMRSQTEGFPENVILLATLKGIGVDIVTPPGPPMSYEAFYGQTVERVASWSV